MELTFSHRAKANISNSVIVRWRQNMNPWLIRNLKYDTIIEHAKSSTKKRLFSPQGDILAIDLKLKPGSGKRNTKHVFISVFML